MNDKNNNKRKVPRNEFHFYLQRANKAFIYPDRTKEIERHRKYRDKDCEEEIDE